ncbi:MAG TPA: flavodoxin [Candidatus Mediterraneibacter pullistercoris]|nr:flavodoxin [Candidatus Mediterraneibacter pullistercoris]
MNVSVVYWSGTGNTQAMAEAVAEGIRSAGAEAVLLEVGNADAESLASENVFALGCPSMGAEQLEETEMEPFVEALVPLASGKKILLFGSYGWGDGEWMREWTERMKNAGAVLVREEGVIANETPDDEALAECRSAGKELAS